MTDGIAIKKDITVEAKQILAHAMNGFCKPLTEAQKAEKEKQMYIAGRHNYWLSLGYAHEVALAKANEDFEWASM